MRYIRTKDRIYDGSRFLREYTGWYFNEHSRLYAFTESEIIKTANTIEELVDEYVDTSSLITTNTGGWLYDEFDRENKCLVYYIEDKRRTIPLNEFDDLSKICGAIFTDKGLIYVAKMNEKGELELI